MPARQYRVRVYDDGCEVLSGREYVAVLDLTPGASLREAEAKLDELALTLARADRARPKDLHRYYLAVHDWETGAFLFHWPTRETDY
jgi:hypothetical protein